MLEAFSFTHFLFDVEGLLETYGYAGMFIISFLESGVFFLLPGDSLLFTAGMLAAAKVFNIYIIMGIFFIGSLFGSVAGYFIGSNLDKLKQIKLIAKYANIIFSEKHLKETHEYLEKRGDITMIFSRFIPIVRTFAPVIAGVGSMPFKKFFIYNLIGSAFWSVSITLSGYVFGREFPQVKDYLEYIFGFILLVTTGPVMFKIYKKYKNRK